MSYLRKHRRQLGLARRAFVRYLHAQEAQPPLDFTHDFARDCETLLHAWRDATPFAFARYGDGEAAILFGGHVRATRDGWRWRGQHDPLLQPLLMALLQCDLPGWYIGVSSASIHPDAHARLLLETRLPLSRVAQAELFLYANYQRYIRSLELSDTLIVGHRCPLETPATPADPAWRDWRRILDAMLSAKESRIALACGPWSCVLAHQYWLATVGAPWRKPIVDFGAAIAVRYRLRKLRNGQGRRDKMARYVPHFHGSQSA